MRVGGRDCEDHAAPYRSRLDRDNRAVQHRVTTSHPSSRANLIDTQRCRSLGDRANVSPLYSMRGISRSGI